MRANKRALANGGKHAGVMRANFGGKTFRLVRAAKELLQEVGVDKL